MTTNTDLVAHLRENLRVRGILGDPHKLEAELEIFAIELHRRSRLIAELREAVRRADAAMHEPVATALAPGRRVHIVRGGRSLCLMQGVPGEWPDGHVWVAIDDKDKATCPECVLLAPGTER